MIHKLKLYPPYFQATLEGRKIFEIRDNSERGFQAGDSVLFEEYEKGIVNGSFTGRKLTADIGYVCNYAQHASNVVFSLVNIKEVK
jgi:uncharacterized protein YqfB (UPF0267 family)